MRLDLHYMRLLEQEKQSWFMMRRSIQPPQVSIDMLGIHLVYADFNDFNMCVTEVLPRKQS